MMTTIRQLARAALRAFGRCVIAPVVVMFSRRPDGPEIPVSVHLLVSSKTWRMGLLSALSLEYFSGKRWRLFVHEDGSVDAAARARIEKKLPGVRFVPRPEADEATARLLEKFPACARNRGRHNLFLKFFDPIAFAPGDKYLILDSDLFFFRRPQWLLDWAVGGERACYYNQDTKEVYCLPREQIEAELGVRLWERFNSGLVCVCREAIALDLGERLLVAFESTAWHPQFFEQTLYALCASAFNRGGPLPPQYEITWNIFRHSGSVCRHYVGPAKFDHLYLEGPATLLFLMALPEALRAILKTADVRKPVRRHLGNGARVVARWIYLRPFWLCGLPAGEVSVHILSQTGRTHESMMSFISFCVHSGKKFPLYVHDDGTMTAGDRMFFRDCFPDVVVIGRAEADEEIGEVLKNFPECAKRREALVFFLKLFDFFHYAPGDRLIVLDNDVVFFRSPRQILDWIELRPRLALFNSEGRESLAIGVHDFKEFSCSPAQTLLNAGFGVVWKSAMDLEFCEKFLRRCREMARLIRRSYLLEQTVWTVLLNEADLEVNLLPSSYQITNRFFRSPGTIMRHYTSFTKHDILYFEALVGLPQLAHAKLRPPAAVTVENRAMFTGGRL